MGLYTTQLYMEIIIINHYEDPHSTTTGSWKVVRFLFSVTQVSLGADPETKTFDFFGYEVP